MHSDRHSEYMIASHIAVRFSRKIVGGRGAKPYEIREIYLISNHVVRHRVHIIFTAEKDMKPRNYLNWTDYLSAFVIHSKVILRLQRIQPFMFGFQVFARGTSSTEAAGWGREGAAFLQKVGYPKEREDQNRRNLSHFAYGPAIYGASILRLAR